MSVSLGRLLWKASFPITCSDSRFTIGLSEVMQSFSMNPCPAGSIAASSVLQLMLYLRPPPSLMTPCGKLGLTGTLVQAVTVLVAAKIPS